MPILQRGRRRDGEPSSASASAPAASELPPYEPPLQPLNQAASRALESISNNRNTRKYDDHLKKSTELIRDAVAATNDRAWENHNAFQQRLQKLAKDGKEKTDDDREEEKYVEQLSERVAGVTGTLEAALRDVIDYRVELEDEPAVLNMVQSELESQALIWRPRKAPKAGRKKPAQQSGDAMDEDGNDAEEQEEEPAEEEDAEMGEGDHGSSAITGLNDVLDRVRQSKTEDWTRMSMTDRYANHNEYVRFKRMLHDAQHPDDGHTLPHASAWFGPDGQPVLPKVGEVLDDPDEDEDIRIAAEVQSFRDPYSMTLIKQPYANNKCNHIYDKSTVDTYFHRGGHEKRCAEAGCEQMLKFSDFYLDQTVLRKIKRQREAEARREAEEFGEDAQDEAVDEEGDTTITDSRTVNAGGPRVKSEPAPTPRVAAAELNDDE